MVDHGVQIESWGGFAEGKNDLFTDPVLTAIGERPLISSALVGLVRGADGLSRTVSDCPAELRFCSVVVPTGPGPDSSVSAGIVEVAAEARAASAPSRTSTK
jgi:hypothetical protein